MNKRDAVLEYLINCQSQVKLSTYMVNDAGIVNHDMIVLHEAPARVVGEVTSRFVGVSLRPAGLVIPLIHDHR